MWYVFFFFFQAEDGIRDYKVTGVQTCALPICYLFRALFGFAFVYCLFIGARLTADCLSEEKREGTLGLLFLTDLKGYDVVFGKLAATSVNSIYALVRSEEHTSELQSPCNLVCRLLLEK